MWPVIFWPSPSSIPARAGEIRTTNASGHVHFQAAVIMLMPPYGGHFLSWFGRREKRRAGTRPGGVPDARGGREDRPGRRAMPSAAAAIASCRALTARVYTVHQERRMANLSETEFGRAMQALVDHYGLERLRDRF